MSQTAITIAFEQWKAQQGAENVDVVLDEFVFANVPGLDPEKPVDRLETIPVASVVHRQAVSKTGVVNENAVVYSVVMGAEVGDFDFNWIGLANKASGILAMVVHAPTQKKVATAAGQQGNVLTRSFLMEYSGAATETQINTPAETWQIDFTARLAAMDERQRVENTDIFGAGAFFGDGWLVVRNGNQYSAQPGAGYVGGLRAELAATQPITVGVKPVKIWLDVCWKGTLTSAWGVEHKLVSAETLQDYQAEGVQHYVFALASIDASGVVTDLRPKGALNEQQASDALKKHEQSRNHPDASIYEKGFTRLSSETNSDSEVLAATSKAVKLVNENANKRVPSTLKINGYTLSGDVNLSAFDVKALSVSGGTLSGDLIVNGADYVTKNNIIDSGDYRSTCGFRINGLGEQRSDELFYERKGVYAAKRTVVISGGKSSIFELCMDGSIVVAHPSGSMTIYPDGNINGSKWSGYISDWINSQILGVQNWVNSREFATNDYVNQRFISDVRLGQGVNLYKSPGTNVFSAPSGYTFSFIDVGDGHEVVAVARPIQKMINGTWYTVSQI